MNVSSRVADGITHGAQLRQGRRLEYLTIGWNSVEAIVSIGAGWLAGSTALVMVPVITSEGIEALRGERCEDAC